MGAEYELAFLCCYIGWLLGLGFKESCLFTVVNINYEEKLSFHSKNNAIRTAAFFLAAPLCKD